PCLEMSRIAVSYNRSRISWPCGVVPTGRTRRSFFERAPVCGLTFLVNMFTYIYHAPEKPAICRTAPDSLRRRLRVVQPVECVCAEARQECPLQVRLSSKCQGAILSSTVQSKSGRP